MALRKSDLRSEAWARIKAHIEERIAFHITQLESLQNTEATTASTRGRIGELRTLLALERAPEDVQRPGDRLALDTAAPASPPATFED